MKLISKYFYVFSFSLLFSVDYTKYGFEIFSFSGDAQTQSMGGVPYENSMSLNNIYSLNEYHYEGRMAFSYAKYYSGMIDLFQSSYIIKQNKNRRLGVELLHKKISNIPNTQNAWEDLGQVISQDEIDYDNIDYYDDQQVSLLLVYSLNLKDTNIGFKIKPFYTSILDYSAFGASFDVGVNRKIGNNYYFGASIEDLYSINYWSTGDSFSVYPTFSLLNSFSFRGYYLAAELSARSNALDNFNYGIGIERDIKKYLKLRFGYSSNESIAAGIEFEFNDVSYAYSYSSHLKDIILGHNHQFSILLDLSKVRL